VKSLVQLAISAIDLMDAQVRAGINEAQLYASQDGRHPYWITITLSDASKCLGEDCNASGQVLHVSAKLDIGEEEGKGVVSIAYDTLSRAVISRMSLPEGEDPWDHCRSSVTRSDSGRWWIWVRAKADSWARYANNYASPEEAHV
jgi:hypothetical protein